MAQETWFAKVEYQADKSEAIISTKWIKDLDTTTLPAFDTLRVYRAFWSDLDEDSPEEMSKRVPEVPELSEEQEKKCLPGYYRVCILGIQENEDGFQMKRTRKTVTRGTKQPGLPKSNKKGNGEQKPSSGSAIPPVQTKRKAVKENLGPSLPSVSAFSGMDNDDGDFNSDDSEKDPTLIPDDQVKVYRASIKSLKKSLLDRCKENSELREEVVKLRKLNVALQEQVIELVPKVIEASRGGRSTSASGCSSRSTSRSSISSCKSRIHSKERDTSHQVASDRSRTTSSSSHASDNEYGQNHKRKNPPVQHSSKDGNMERTPSRHHLHDKRFCFDNSSPALSPSSCMIDNNEDIDLFSLERTNSHDSDKTLVPDDNNSDLMGNPSEDKNADKLTGQVDTREVHEVDRTLFCPGYSVRKDALAAIESRPLNHTEDSTYVKELAVLIFGVATLSTSSIKERKFKAGPGATEEPRKKLDPEVIEEIQRCLKRRVIKELEEKKLPMGPDECKRFSEAKVNRYIYEKIKKLRAKTPADNPDLPK